MLTPHVLRDAELRQHALRQRGSDLQHRWRGLAVVPRSWANIQMDEATSSSDWSRVRARETAESPSSPSSSSWRGMCQSNPSAAHTRSHPQGGGGGGPPGPLDIHTSQRSLNVHELSLASTVSIVIVSYTRCVSGVLNTYSYDDFHSHWDVVSREQIALLLMHPSTSSV